MKNNFFLIFFSFFIFSSSLAENLLIEAKSVSLDKDGMTSIFEKEVEVKTEEKIIKSDYLRYNKKTGFLLLKNNIVATDKENNVIRTELAEYYEKDKILKSIGSTKIITSGNYELEGSDIEIDHKKKIITSKNPSILTDLDGNKIYLDNFDYFMVENIFKSVGLIRVSDNKNNIFEFSQIYI